MGGVDFVGGYKQFFGKKKHWGVRYYGLISLQGGGFSEKTGNKYPTRGPWAVSFMAWASMRCGHSFTIGAQRSERLWAWPWGDKLGLRVQARLMMCAKPKLRMVFV